MKRIVLCAVLMLLISCSPAETVQSLRRVLTVVQVALPVVLAQTGAPAETQAAILRYLSAVLGATRQTSVVLMEEGSDAERAARITQAYAGALAPVLPAGTPREVAGIVLTVSDAVAAFLSQYGQWNVKAAENTSRTTALSGRDRNELVKILQQSGALSDYVQQEKSRVERRISLAPAQ